jgi:hypothetical protein
MMLPDIDIGGNDAPCPYHGNKKHGSHMINPKRWMEN